MILSNSQPTQGRFLYSSCSKKICFLSLSVDAKLLAGEEEGNIMTALTIFVFVRMVFICKQHLSVLLCSADKGLPESDAIF